jgi:lipopolysaccharide export system protein LptC
MSDLDTHSRLIAWLKIVLPLVALVILSTLFLVARVIDPEQAIPYADVDVAERLREPRMTEPTYAGVTDDGSALTLVAAEARPDASDPSSGEATALVGTLETPDGGKTALTAQKARLDGTARRIDLSGGVQIVSPAGWQVQSERMSAMMDVTEVTAPTPVRAEGPAGVVTADAMTLTSPGETKGRYLLVFNGNVKLVYQPSN